MNWVELSWGDHQQQTNESFNDPDVIETSSWQLWQFTGCRWCTWKVKLCLLVCLGWNRLSHVYCLLFVCCTCAEDDCSQPILWSDWDSPLTHKHQVCMCCTILWWHYQLVMIALLYSFFSTDQWTSTLYWKLAENSSHYLFGCFCIGATQFFLQKINTDYNEMYFSYPCTWQIVCLSNLPEILRYFLTWSYNYFLFEFLHLN